MKFKEYIEKCQEMLKQFPESAELEVIYAEDDEGNGYHKVMDNFFPAPGQVHDLKAHNLEFVNFFLPNSGIESCEKEDVNCIIIN